jgi:hypothetical protein
MNREEKLVNIRENKIVIIKNEIRKCTRTKISKEMKKHDINTKNVVKLNKNSKKE